MRRRHFATGYFSKHQYLMFSQISCCIKVGRSIFPNTSPLQKSSVRFSLLMFPYQYVDCTTHIGFGRTSVCTGKLAGIFTMGPQYKPGHKAIKIPCVPFPTSFWASFPPRCGMEGDPIPLIISDPPFPGCHSLETTQFVGSSIGASTLRSMFLFPLSVFTSRYFLVSL